MICHSERSEESLFPSRTVEGRDPFGFAQGKPSAPQVLYFAQHLLRSG